MLDEKTFNLNVALWARTYPKAAVFLPYLENHSLSFCQTKQGELNLKSVINKKTHYIHSNTDAAAEADKSVNTPDLQNAEALIIYGVGLGYSYEAAKKWLKQNKARKLIFLEDDLSIIRSLFETPQGTKILKDPQVELHYFEDADFIDMLSNLTELYWRLMTTKIKVIALNYYKKTRAERFLLLHHKIIFDANLRAGLLSEYLDYGAAFFRNFYPNLLNLPKSYLANNLWGKFRNVPAIICGAGPSLKKQIPLLRTLQDKALIFAGGSAMNALNAEGFNPHLGAGIDPNPDQFDRLSKNSAYEVPFLYRNRMLVDAFNMIHGPRLYVKGSGGYDVACWFEDQLGIKGDEIEEGYNVVTFSLELAHVFGCNPIIFVGCDLAYTNMEMYSPGVVKNSKINKKEILNVADFDNQAIERQDIYGKPIFTLWKWIGESHWMRDFAIRHPTITMINATEGGIGFPGVPNEPLKKVIKNHLKGNWDIRSILQGEIQNSKMPQVTISKVVSAMKEMVASLVRCRENLDILLEENETMSHKLKTEKAVTATLQSGRAALFEIELAEEPGYIHVLNIFNKTYSCVLNRDLQKLHIVPGKAPNWRTGLKKLALSTKKLKFLHNVASVNIQIIEKTLESVKSKK